jgi:hypothetical protein
MNSDWKLTLVILASVALVIVGLALGIGSLSLLSSPDMCANEVLREHSSPGGKLKVVVFQRDCGATTGFSTQASILSAEEDLPEEGGNLFVSDTNHGAAPSGPGGGPEVRVGWKNARELWLSHHRNARIFKAEREVQGISVSYSRFNG